MIIVTLKIAAYLVLMHNNWLDDIPDTTMQYRLKILSQVLKTFASNVIASNCRKECKVRDVTFCLFTTYFGESLHSSDV